MDHLSRGKPPTAHAPAPGAAGWGGDAGGDGLTADEKLDELMERGAATLALLRRALPPGPPGQPGQPGPDPWAAPGRVVGVPGRTRMRASVGRQVRARGCGESRGERPRGCVRYPIPVWYPGTCVAGRAGVTEVTV